MLSDGNHAGTGDLIRARLNTEIDADGRKLTNRDTLKITGWRGPDAEVRRQRLDGTWTAPFRVPRSYLAHNAELAYGGNVHVAQGRTVDTAHLLVTGLPVPAGPVRRHDPGPGSQHRARRHRQDRPGRARSRTSRPPPNPCSPSVLQRDADDLSATEQIRHAQEWAGGTGHLLHLWSAAVRQALYPDIDEQIKARLTDIRSLAVPAGALPAGAAAHAAGRPAGRARRRRRSSTGSPHAPMDGARSVSSVLHGRLQRLQLPAQGHGVTWAQRTPENAPALAHELAAGLDDRRRELGERALENPEPWLTRHLGAPPGPDASPVLREDYARRAGTAAAYREARGITDPEQAVSLDPHPEPELEALRRDTVRALEIADEQAEIRAMSRGELEAQVLEGDRAQATAPRDVSSQLRLTCAGRGRCLAAVGRRRSRARPGAGR